MNIAAKVKNSSAFAVAVDNQIRLIERLVMPKRDRDKLKFCPVSNVRKSANPGRVELARGKQGCDFLIGASRNEGNRVSSRPQQIRLQPPKEFEVVGEKNRSEAKSNGSASSNFRCAANRRREHCRCSCSEQFTSVQPMVQTNAHDLPMSFACIFPILARFQWSRNKRIHGPAQSWTGGGPHPHGLLDAPLSRRANDGQMTSPDLPAELKAALDDKLRGFSRNEAAGRAASISKTYREGGGSGAIRFEADALAYALARMPATYAAVTAALNALVEIRPDFAPKKLLDVGAGPGTATWAAAQAFPSLQDFTLLDANEALRTLALGLARDSVRLRDIAFERGEARATLTRADPTDLVVASYMIGEIGDAERRVLADLMWQKTGHTLLVVEPGTPAGYGRIMELRGRLIALGAHVAAPCPHDGQCPLHAPDWCHFTQRLQRSRAHKQVKGAELPFEDERFAYVALTRVPAARRLARVLAQPVVSKVEVTAKLCTPDGLAITKVPHRAKAEYAATRRWRWGDGVRG